MAWTDYIYLLKDPDTDEVRYVGVTSHPEDREKKHRGGGVKTFAKGTAPISKWQKELREAGKRPVFEVVTKLSGEWREVNFSSRAVEWAWICHYTHIGHRLLNDPRQFPFGGPVFRAAG